MMWSLWELYTNAFGLFVWVVLIAFFVTLIAKFTGRG